MQRLASRALRVGAVAGRRYSDRPADISPTVPSQFGDNSPERPWDFSPHSWKKVQRELEKYPPTKKRSAVMALLHIAQRQEPGGWLPKAAMRRIAELLEMPAVDVFSVATFYVMYNRQPVGKYHIQFCVTTPCMVSGQGSDHIIHAVEQHLNIGMNEMTPDGLFTLGEMECMGCCVNAPMMVISDYTDPDPNKFKYDFIEDLTAEKAIEIIEGLKTGKYPTVGPQNGRQWCMPKGGRTSLKEPPPGPTCRAEIPVSK
eukprot:TRINITY_DN41709_c0_g1_i1.p1 TRINITY_DN41709_c0_g1~~TRINITY_DN41709_c0_g1_i1.p1  ORF type:complete len:257 (+),score=34.93 TRINITY_DN41709_c0_g1_i1:42-812(+)